MRHFILPGLLVAGLMAAVLAAAENKPDKNKKETIEGRIMKVDPSGHLLTVKLKEKGKLPEPPKRDFPLDPATKFVFFGPAGKKEMTRKEAYRDERLREGAEVAVVSDGTGKVLEIRVGTPPKEGRKNRELRHDAP